MRLAIAIAVVGSHRTEFFEAVFGILFEWEVFVAHLVNSVVFHRVLFLLVS